MKSSLKKQRLIRIAIAALLTSGFTAHAVPIPNGFHLSCNDGTYLYNVLDVRENKGFLKIEGRQNKLEFDLSTPAAHGLGWKQLKYSAIVPTSSCFLNPTNSKLIHCKFDNLIIQLASGTGARGSQRKVKISNVKLETRRVDLSSSSGAPRGYEFAMIHDSNPLKLEIFSQRFMDGSAHNQSARCLISVHNLDTFP